ncbi:ADP-ribosylation factor-like protein 6-interacting protein 6 [Synchiropus splendidus]|uniref:ADP-ribosylation factor-like protein 6-interacting protein 6 n=1 Tax=Synchiropus splendidus TaxID=270530 RepID=UPI00237D5EE4|nr:ADP-ribosylation factor-like protein 6-interacting protein 6 [Synchiropus splendidus]
MIGMSVAGDQSMGGRTRVAVLSSVLCSAFAVAAAGVFSALLYPILKELRVERIRKEDGTEERMLGFWTILVMSLLAGCVIATSSWMLAYLVSVRPGLVSTTFRKGSGPNLQIGYSIAFLNGVMATVTAIWNLV